MAGARLGHRPHDEFEGLQGNKKNISDLDKRLKSLGIAGILVGGCADGAKDFPRKDIDVILSESAGRERFSGYDTWLYFGDRTENVNYGKTYNSLGMLSLALGNLPPGLHVITDFNQNARTGLPVTSYISIDGLVKNQHDLLGKFHGKVVSFSFQEKQYIGRMISSDMWFAKFDDIVQLTGYESDDSSSKQLRMNALKTIFSEEFSELEALIGKYLSDQLKIKAAEDIEPYKVHVNGVPINNLGREYHSLKYRNGQTSIPGVLLEKYNPKDLERKIMEQLGALLTAEAIGYLAARGANQSIEDFLNKLGKSFFVSKNESDLESLRTQPYNDIYATFHAEKIINLDGEELKIQTNDLVNQHYGLPQELTERMNALRNNLIDFSFLSPQRPDIFRQYAKIAEANLLPLFSGYVGNKTLAKQAVICITDKPPILMKPFY